MVQGVSLLANLVSVSGGPDDVQGGRGSSQGNVALALVRAGVLSALSHVQGLREVRESTRLRTCIGFFFSLISILCVANSRTRP